MLDNLEKKERFLREVKGSRVFIPDLYALFPNWKFNVNGKYEIVKNKTERWLERCLFSTCLHINFLSFGSVAGSKVIPFATACKSPILLSSQRVYILTLLRKSVL